MAILSYNGIDFGCGQDETVLAAALRQGVTLPFSCQNGSCHVCLRRNIKGNLPAAAQKGLRPALKTAGYFLPCKCVPTGHMVFEPPRDEDLYTTAVVYEKEFLNSNICRLLLEPVTMINYRAGQYIHLRRHDGLTRSYSLASFPDEDYYLELHIKRMQNGQLSNWIFDTLKPHDEIEIYGPEGQSYYAASDKLQPILLVCTETGLAPVIGIARDALAKQHKGDIFLYHGARYSNGLYLHGVLRELFGRYSNFHFVQCVSRSKSADGTQHGRVHEIALKNHPDLRGWRLHIAGSPDMVKTMQNQAVSHGANPVEIFSDPFDLKDLRSTPRPSYPTDRRKEPEPDPEMWTALREGVLLREILIDFYTRVFEDARLAPFFSGVTRDRLVEKVYSFMAQAFGGQNLYFGDRPRNAHHWMVIPDELFDYRENLMKESLQKCGLAEKFIERWTAYEQSFRPDIVKAHPWPRVVNGEELPLEGYGELDLEVGALCDSCQKELPPGTRIRYHLRLGKIYCPTCQNTTV